MRDWVMSATRRILKNCIRQNWKRRSGITPALRNVGNRDLMILTRNNDLPTPLVFLRETSERGTERASINFAIDIRFVDTLALNYRLKLISLLKQAHHSFVPSFLSSMKRQDSVNNIKRGNLMVDDVHLYFILNQPEMLHVLFNESWFSVEMKVIFFHEIYLKFNNYFSLENW